MSDHSLHRSQQYVGGLRTGQSGSAVEHEMRDARHRMGIRQSTALGKRTPYRILIQAVLRANRRERARITEVLAPLKIRGKQTVEEPVLRLPVEMPCAQRQQAMRRGRVGKGRNP